MSEKWPGGMPLWPELDKVYPSGEAPRIPPPDYSAGDWPEEYRPFEVSGSAEVGVWPAEHRPFPVPTLDSAGGPPTHERPWVGGSVTTPLLGDGRQQSHDVSLKDTVLSSVFFRVWCIEGSADFAEMSGINSEMEQTEYVETGPLGPMYSRHGGRCKPPTITLKRALKTGTDSTWLWTWQSLARRCLPGMHRDAVLMLYSSGDDPGMPARVNFTLVNAFPTKIEVAPMKVGGTEVVSQSVILQCDDILDTNVI